MQVKFNKRLDDFQTLIMFDLASHVSGVCLWDIKNNCPINSLVLKTSGKHELPAAELYSIIDDFFNSLWQKGIDPNSVIVSKEMAPLNAGRFSTIQTLTSLAKSHAILDYYCYAHNICCYDYKGIAPISTHSYLKKIMNWDNKHPVEKEDIRNFLYQNYDLKEITLDESDAIFLAKTFVDVKWNKDIDEYIKELKKHKKTLKAPHAIAKIDQDILFVESLKRKGG